MSVAKPLRPLLLAASFLLFGCEPKLVVGDWTCTEDGKPTPIPDKTDAIALPWSTGFENRFCDYTQLGGFCYGDPMASFKTVKSPVHGGRFAAEFDVTSADTDGNQTRCVRQGALPNAAYYGAWYWVPTLATNSATWNLLHFRGASDPAATSHGLWDISLLNDPNGDLRLAVYDFLHSSVRTPANAPAIPLASWFHIQFYFKRAADATGEVRLYQDGEQVLALTGLVTDDTPWAQWYVGNLVTSLMPPNSTVYVDDVTIDSTL